MTAVILPPEIVAECADRLSCISAAASRDGATLNRLLLRLLSKPQHGLLLGNLKRYARDNKQFGADEVEEVIVIMEAAMDPGHIKHLARCQARRDKAHAEFLERQKQPQPAVWQSPVPAPGFWQAPRQKKGQGKRKAPRRNGNVIAGPWLEGA